MEADWEAGSGATNDSLRDLCLTLDRLGVTDAGLNWTDVCITDKGLVWL